MNFIKGGKKPMVNKTTKEQVCLGPRTEITLPGVFRRFKPGKFFDSGPSWMPSHLLWVSPLFEEYILTVAGKVVGPFPEKKAASFDLECKANDATVRSCLTVGYIFEAGEFCARLASLIKRHKHSKDRILRDDGYSNMFYVLGMGAEVVRVSVKSIGMKWFINLDDTSDVIVMHPGRRFFSNC